MSNQLEINQAVLPVETSSLFTNDLVRSVKNIGDLLVMGQSGENSWLIDPLVPESGIVSLIGEPASGKSYLSLQIAHSVSLGQPLFNTFPCVQGNVLLISMEDNTLETGKRALQLGFSENLPIYYSSNSEWIFSTEKINPALDQVIETNNIKLVIVDSFRRALDGDENASSEVTKMHKSFKRLTDKGLSVLFIHHQGKSSDQKSRFQGRGSSDITAMVDYQYDIKKTNDIILINQSKARYTKQQSPFTVSFPSFEGDNNEFKFLEWQQGPDLIPTTSTLTETAVLEALEASEDRMYQGEIEQVLNERGTNTSHGTISKVLTSLVATNRVVCVPDGRRNYYSLPVVDPSISQATNTVDELTDAEVV